MRIYIRPMNRSHDSSYDYLYSYGSHLADAGAGLRAGTREIAPGCADSSEARSPASFYIEEEMKESPPHPDSAASPSPWRTGWCASEFLVNRESVTKSPGPAVLTRLQVCSANPRVGAGLHGPGPLKGDNVVQALGVDRAAFFRVFC